MKKFLSFVLIPACSDSLPGSGRPRGIKKPYRTVSANLPAEYYDKLKAATKAGLSVIKFIQRAVDRELSQ